MDAQRGYVSPTSLSRVKLQPWPGGSPTFRASAGTVNPGHCHSCHLRRLCSVHGKAPDLPTFVQFLYKASQGSAKQYNIFVDISVPRREALLCLCVSHLWLCQKIVHSLFSQAKPFACAEVASKQTGGSSWRKETWDHCTQSHLSLFSHIYWTQLGSNPSVQETC